MNEEKKPSNKLSVYLIKEELTDIKDIFDESDIIKSITISDKAKLYYSNSEPSLPSWINKFFGKNTADQLRSVLYTAYVSAALLIDVEVEPGVVRKFVLAFGLGGWQLLLPGSYEERFGLMTTLNLVSPLTIRSIDKSNMGLSPKQAREQIVSVGDISDFGIDIEQDLVRAITGKCVNIDHGTTITGKDSLHISSKVDISNLADKLKIYYTAAKSDIYKVNYSWIDHIAEVKDSTKITILNTELAVRLAGSDLENIWLAVPEVVDWSDIKGFMYRGDSASLCEDLTIADLLESLVVRGRDISIENIKKQKIVAIRASDSMQSQKWNAYNCLYAEVKLLSDFYTLNNGKWYRIENDFVKKVNEEYHRILDSNVVLPSYKQPDTSENSYNTRAANELNLTLMDAKNITYGGGHSKIEFCDIFDYEKSTLYHVKKYGGSSVLSHLFNQGLVSAQLMLSDVDFRSKVNDELPEEERFAPVDNKPNPQDYEVVFAVISKSSKPLNIPFFSKVSLKNVKMNLELYGVKKISLIKIQSEE
ncbi:MAG: TIGR04141 family sporadically distributed protein [Candidatus Saccharibacteria bacterium]